MNMFIIKLLGPKGPVRDACLALFVVFGAALALPAAAWALVFLADGGRR
jgi:hypothetical protein